MTLLIHPNFDAKLHNLKFSIAKTTQEKMHSNVILYQNAEKLYQNTEKRGGKDIIFAADRIVRKI